MARRLKYQIDSDSELVSDRKLADQKYKIILIDCGDACSSSKVTARMAFLKRVNLCSPVASSDWTFPNMRLSHSAFRMQSRGTKEDTLADAAIAETNRHGNTNYKLRRHPHTHLRSTLSPKISDG